MSESELQWIKASRSDTTEACVEVAVDGNLIALRHSRLPDLVIHYSRAEFAAFVDGVKGGEFDHLVDPRPT